MMNSLTEHVKALEAGDLITAAYFLGDTPALVLADGRVIVGSERAQTTYQVSEGGILHSVAALDGRALYTGGDDGKLLQFELTGTTTEIADEKGRWIDALALSSDGALAWSAGRNVRVKEAKGAVKTASFPSTPQGLAFMPKGFRLAVAHVDGVSLWFPNLETAPEKLTWKGPHLDVLVSQDGRFVITSMQENQLHGWRLPEKAHMRMSGYPGKTRSFSWSHDGNWLATSGAEAAIIWPFGSKEGPMGKAPRECGVRPQRVSKVAFHPKALVLAIGYVDGCIMMVRMTDGAELWVRKPYETAISALTWDGSGKRLMFGTEAGEAGILYVPASQ